MRVREEPMCWMAFTSGSKTHFHLVLFLDLVHLSSFPHCPWSKYISIDPVFWYRLRDSPVMSAIATYFILFSSSMLSTVPSNLLIHLLWADSWKDGVNYLSAVICSFHPIEACFLNIALKNKLQYNQDLYGVNKLKKRKQYLDSPFFPYLSCLCTLRLFLYCLKAHRLQNMLVLKK